MKSRNPAKLLLEDIKLNLLEDRREDVTYQEEFVEDRLDEVVAVLEGRQGSYATRLVREYKETHQKYKEVKEKRGELRDEVLEYFGELFDAEDEIATRIVETAGATLQLDKPSSYTREKFDEEGFMEELLELVPELEDKLMQLKDKYTDVQKVQRSSRVRVKRESITGKLRKAWKVVKEMVSNFVSGIMNWSRSYDKRLDQLKARFLRK